jgi:hypothetical protein
MIMDYTISPARYAKGQMVVHCPSTNGYKTRAARLIGDGLNCRWVGRSRGYVASPAKVAKFEALYAAGFDACVMGSGLCNDSHDRLSVREAMAAMRAQSPQEPLTAPSPETAVERPDPPAPPALASEAEDMTQAEAMAEVGDYIGGMIGDLMRRVAELEARIHPLPPQISAIPNRFPRPSIHPPSSLSIRTSPTSARSRSCATSARLISGRGRMRRGAPARWSPRWTG